MIWIIGNEGMLGQDVSAALKGLDVVESDMNVDITSPEALSAFVEEKEINWIVNCSAYTAVDQAEDDTDKAFLINETGVKNIAELAARLKAKVIHVSTDYVFPGNENRPLTEDDHTGPIGVYGASKLAGEVALAENCKQHFILRTAWLYGLHGNNFVYTMLKLMNSRDSLSVVNDQIGSPTRTEDLASVIRLIIECESDAYGVYHYSGAGECSWYDFARAIYSSGKQEGLVSSDCTITPCDSSQFPTKAKRPAFSLLSKHKVQSRFGCSIPQWGRGLTDFLTLNKNEIAAFLQG